LTTNKQAPARNPNGNSLPTEIEGFASLAELTLDLRWSWNYATNELWRKLDPAPWEFTQNPRVVLQTTRIPGQR
jgi:starch phosphorylase